MIHAKLFIKEKADWGVLLWLDSEHAKSLSLCKCYVISIRCSIDDCVCEQGREAYIVCVLCVCVRDVYDYSYKNAGGVG